VQPNGSGWSPLGSARKRDVHLSPGWRQQPAGRPQHDVALITLQEPVGKKLGWFGLPNATWAAAQLLRQSAPASAVATSPAHRLGNSSSVLKPEDLGEALGGDAATLTVVGYPDNKINGSMWAQSCRPVRWGFDNGLLWHACATRGGNSGSPIFIREAARGPSGGGSGTAAVVVAMHVASLRAARGSMFGRGLEAELRAGGLPVELADDTAESQHEVSSGDSEGGALLVVPVGVPFAGETLSWLERAIQDHTC
jgi:hypothetical protein